MFLIRSEARSKVFDAGVGSVHLGSERVQRNVMMPTVEPTTLIIRHGGQAATFQRRVISVGNITVNNAWSLKSSVASLAAPSRASLMGGNGNGSVPIEFIAIASDDTGQFLPRGGNRRRKHLASVK